MWNTKRTAAILRHETFDQETALNITHAEYASLIENITQPGMIPGQDEPFVHTPEPAADPLLTMEAIRARYPFMPTEIKSMGNRLMEEKVANITSYHIQSSILASLSEVPLRMAKTLEKEVIDTTTANLSETCVERVKRITLYGQQVLSTVVRNLEDLVNGEEYRLQPPEPYAKPPKIDFESKPALKDQGEPIVKDGMVVLELKALSKVSADEWAAVQSGYKTTVQSVTIRDVKYKEYPKVPIWFSNVDAKPPSLMASIGPDGADMSPSTRWTGTEYSKVEFYTNCCN